jgi:hypothetical protein
MAVIFVPGQGGKSVQAPKTTKEAFKQVTGKEPTAPTTSQPTTKKSGGGGSSRRATDSLGQPVSAAPQVTSQQEQDKQRSLVAQNNMIASAGKQSDSNYVYKTREDVYSQRELLSVASPTSGRDRFRESIQSSNPFRKTKEFVIEKAFKFAGKGESRGQSIFSNPRVKTLTTTGLYFVPALGTGIIAGEALGTLTPGGIREVKGTAKTLKQEYSIPTSVSYIGAGVLTGIGLTSIGKGTSKLLGFPKYQTSVYAEKVMSGEIAGQTQELYSFRAMTTQKGLLGGRQFSSVGQSEVKLFPKVQNDNIPYISQTFGATVEKQVTFPTMKVGYTKPQIFGGKEMGMVTPKDDFFGVRGKGITSSLNRKGEAQYQKYFTAGVGGKTPNGNVNFFFSQSVNVAEGKVLKSGRGSSFSLIKDPFEFKATESFGGGTTILKSFKPSTKPFVEQSVKQSIQSGLKQQSFKPTNQPIFRLGKQSLVSEGQQVFTVKTSQFAFQKDSQIYNTKSFQQPTQETFLKSIPTYKQEPMLVDRQRSGLGSSFGSASKTDQGIAQIFATPTLQQFKQSTKSISSRSPRGMFETPFVTPPLYFDFDKQLGGYTEKKKKKKGRKSPFNIAPGFTSIVANLKIKSPLKVSKSLGVTPFQVRGLYSGKGNYFKIV